MYRYIASQHSTYPVPLIPNAISSCNLLSMILLKSRAYPIQKQK